MTEGSEEIRESTREFEIAPTSGVQRSQQAFLVMLTGNSPGRIVTLTKSEYLMGRGDDTDVQLDDEGLSRQHAKIQLGSGGVHLLADMGSTNGTFLNGVRLSEPRALADGDRFQIGVSSIFKYALQDEIEFFAAKKLYESTVRDALTGAHNRHYLDERLNSEVSFALRQEAPLTVLLVDIDHFKSINDQHGHSVGDQALKTVAEGLIRQVRIEDVVARYGGEEFVVIARGTDKENAALLAERLRSHVEMQVMPIEGKMIQLSVSIGGASLSEHFATPEALIVAADAAMYKAKASGRNRVCFSDTSNTSSLIPRPNDT